MTAARAAAASARGARAPRVARCARQLRVKGVHLVAKLCLGAAAHAHEPGLQLGGARVRPPGPDDRYAAWDEKWNTSIIFIFVF